MRKIPKSAIKSIIHVMRKFIGSVYTLVLWAQKWIQLRKGIARASFEDLPDMEEILLLHFFRRRVQYISTLVGVRMNRMILVPLYIRIDDHNRGT